MKKIFLSVLVVSALFGCHSSNTSGISKVSFNAGACFGKCPVFTITIDSAGNALYSADMNNERDGNFKTVIKKPQLDSLWMLLGAANPAALKDEYTANITDLPSYDLIVNYRDGAVKKIHEYGNKAPAELYKVFDFMTNLRENQDWK